MAARPFSPLSPTAHPKASGLRSSQNRNAKREESAMRFFVAKTAAKRATGQRPSRTQAFTAAVATAGMAGVLAYKILRSNGSSDSKE
jgi:hypothetical protein